MTTQKIACTALIDLGDTLAEHLDILDGMPPQWQEEMFRSDMARLREVISLLEAIPHS